MTILLGCFEDNCDFEFEASWFELILLEFCDDGRFRCALSNLLFGDRLLSQYESLEFVMNLFESSDVTQFPILQAQSESKGKIITQCCE